MAVMKASELVAKLRDIAENHKTLYVMGCFGAPMTAANKKRYINHHVYNQKNARVKMINAATPDTFGFDCVCLIKGVLWGWNGDKKKSYGGATYKANGVPDVDANGFLKVCSNISTDFSKIEVGEVVWTDGHVGVYIGDGLAVECTPAWKNRVQITACNCAKPGYNTRKWKKHGKLPYVEYDASDVAKPVEKPASKVATADKRDISLKGAYVVAANSGLHIRSDAGTENASFGVMKKGTVVHNYGYYSLDSKGAKWLYVKTSDGVLGFCHSAWLQKR